MVTFRALLASVLIGAVAAAPHPRPATAVGSPSPSRSSPTPSPTKGQTPPWVNLHVIGNNNSKVFEGQLSNVVGQTIITTTSGGSHPCGEDTDNASLPGGAPILALDKAASKKKFTYDGTWDASTANFDITTISTYVNNGNATWAVYVNHDFAANQPSCSKSLNWGSNEVWFIYNPAQYQHFLHLTGLHGSSVPMGKPFQVTGRDYLTGQPVQGATVMGNTTDASGHATIELADCGPYNLRAKMAGSLDSNWSLRSI